jgi:hypothetical protein
LRRLLRLKMRMNGIASMIVVTEINHIHPFPFF